MSDMVHNAAAAELKLNEEKQQKLVAELDKLNLQSPIPLSKVLSINGQLTTLRGRAVYLRLLQETVTLEPSSLADEAAQGS